MITSFARGHLIEYKFNLKQWVFADTGELFNKDNRSPCVRCGSAPTVEGYDACIGFLAGYTVQYVVDMECTDQYI